MGKPLNYLLAFTLSSQLLFAELKNAPLKAVKPPVGFLIQTKEYVKAIDQYLLYTKKIEHHDFELLEQMALGLLNQGTISQDPEEQLLCIFGASLAHTSLPYGFMQECLMGMNPQNQLACLQLLSLLQDDRCDDIINKAMSSPYFITRVEAANILASRKAKSSVGQIEGLMYKIPQEFRFMFAEFFARIGTFDAIAILKQMMNDHFYHNRIAAVLAAATHGRDDLLPSIRAHLTHPNNAEQEACASALGFLKDTKAIKALEKLSKKSADNTRLAALRSLYFLGIKEVKEEIFSFAKEKNLFAISLLGDIPSSEEVLIPLLKDENLNIKFNATLSLLRLKSSKATPFLINFLLKDMRDFGFIPHQSTGGSLQTYKVISSSYHKDQLEGFDILGFSYYLRENILKECIELPEEDFLYIITTILNSRQKELVPASVELLAKKGTPECIRLLEKYSDMTGAPLVRAYANLTLFKMKSSEHYAQRVRSWLENQKGEELIRLRPPVLSKEKPIYKSFELSPEENSGLLVNCCLALAEKHDEKSIDLILSLLKEGNPKNRPLLAAVLLNALN